MDALETARTSNSAKDWDQFAANESLGAKGGYSKKQFSMDLYTTKLDKTKVTSQQEKDAIRIAREIEGKDSANPHVREERGRVRRDDDLCGNRPLSEVFISRPNLDRCCSFLDETGAAGPHSRNRGQHGSHRPHIEATLNL